MALSQKNLESLLFTALKNSIPPPPEGTDKKIVEEGEKNLKTLALNLSDAIHKYVLEAEVDVSSVKSSVSVVPSKQVLPVSVEQNSFGKLK